jgi:hypothetical protein
VHEEVFAVRGSASFCFPNFQLKTMYLTSFQALRMCALSLSALLPIGIHAQAVTNGLTYTYYFDGDRYPWDGPAIGFASAGTLGSQTAFGHSEFDLAGKTFGSAVLSFRLSGAYCGSSECQPGSSTVYLGVYEGDNLAKLPGVNAPPFDNPGANEFGQEFASFSTGNDGQGNSLLVVGQTFSYNVTSFYNQALLNGDLALGIGIQATTPYRTTFAFDNFRLTVSPNEFTPAVPEPETYALLLAGLFVTGAVARHRARSKA